MIGADRRKLAPSIRPPPRQSREISCPKIADHPPGRYCRTDETCFGGFVTIPLGIFAKTFGTNLEIVQLHFRILTKQHPGEIAMYKYLSCLIVLVVTTTALAQNPIPRQGSSCPTGTYKSGDYCKPIKSNSGQVIIKRSGRKCPTGFYKSGNYCKRMSSSDKEALPRDGGAKCPTGWSKSGGYCVKR
jgi:hypothetical protein